MHSLFDLPAPAKLNLFLHVIGRRSDGYHQLQSAMMLIDWCDTLHIDCRTDGVISREDLDGPPLPAEDLIVRAARALQKASASPLGAHIGVHKRIPAQAGMGGGSSDAACTLLALNRLWRLNLPLHTLSAIGLTLGADVPFFLLGSHAWVEGIGERLTPLTLPAARFVVVKPLAGLETAKIFAHPQLRRNTETAILPGLAASPFDFGRNDLQDVAALLCCDVSDALSWLAAQGLHGRMTGSGSAVFALLPDSKVPAAIPVGWQMRICNSLSEHPLKGWAQGNG